MIDEHGNNIPCKLPCGKRNPAYIKAWNDSPAGRASIKKYQQSEKGQRSAKRSNAKRVTPDMYADRIMNDLERRNESFDPNYIRDHY